MLILRRIIPVVDRVLRRCQGVFEFSITPHCVLRIALTRAAHSLCLADGVHVEQGALIADLHLWNEQLLIPSHGPNFVWVNHFRRQMFHSLQELARYSERSPNIKGVVAFRARVAFATPGRQEKLARIAAKFGFERIAVGRTVFWKQRVHHFFENFWFAGLVWTFNPRGLRRRRFIRLRDEFWISRTALIAQLNHPRSRGAS